MTGSTSHHADALIATLQRQAALLRDLQHMGEQRRQLFEDDAVEAMPELLDRRQRTVDELLELQKQLDDSQPQWSPWVASLDPATRERIDALIKELSQLHEAVRLQDDRDAARLRAMHTEVGKLLQLANRSNKAVNAYQSGAGAVTPPSQLTNRQG